MSAPVAAADVRSHFGMHSLPFTREIETRDLLRLPLYDDAIDGLHRTLEHRLSAAAIGPAGTGKSSVLRALKARLPEARYRVIYVKLTDVSRRDLCLEISRAAGLAPGRSYPAMVHRLQEHVVAVAGQEGQRVILAVDDAHEFRTEVLGLVRALTNFEMDSRLMLSLVLVGQPALAKMLHRPEHDDVAYRISFYAQLGLLSRDELRRYVEHRTTIAGARTALFDTGAMDAIFEITRGNLRATDTLALHALDLAARRTIAVVDASLVTEARRWVRP